MPGVPSGRGCQGCRKQKKKCDLAQPACSRCSRLRIECVGAGWKHFKFKEDSRSSLLSNRSSKSQSPRSASSTPPKEQTTCMLQPLSRVPSSESTSLALALVGSLSAHDVRFHLSWVYGDFIEYIPQRIGTSRALDTAVDALLCSHTHMAQAHAQIVANHTPSFESITKYTNAIKTLRITLDNPVKACETETLCAVTLLMICQSFVGSTDGGWMSHGEGAAQILKARKHLKVKDGFEERLLLMLRGPVLFEALTNPKISFTPMEWRKLVAPQISEAVPEDTMMSCLAHAPSLIQRGTIARLTQSNLEPLISETRKQYQILKSKLAEHRERYEAVRYLPPQPIKARATRIHCHYQRMYGIWLTVSLYFNCIYKALDPNDIELQNDSIRFCEEAIDLGDKAVIYRPLGSSWVVLALSAAWCNTTDPIARARIELYLADYQKDAIGIGQETTDKALHTYYRRLNLLDIASCV